MQRMEDAADSHRDKLIVRLLADTGMRSGELLRLTPTDIQRVGTRDVLKVRGKGDRERLVPMTPAVAKRLQRFAARTRPQDTTSARIFLSSRRSPRTGVYGRCRRQGSTS